MMALVRLGWRDLARNRRFALLFICNLSIGLIGLLLVGSFARSVDHHLATHLREMLTGDLMVQSSRPLTDQEEKISRTIAGSGSRFSRQISFYTMVKGGSSAKLTQIVAIDEAYPLYGRFLFSEYSHPPEPHPITGLQQHRQVLMSPETARSFGRVPGEKLSIGQAEFTVAPWFEREPGGDLTALNLAPKIYVGLPHLEEAGLIRFGSRITYKTFIRLPETADSAAIASQFTQAFERLTNNTPEIRVVTAADGNRRLERILGYFNSFLGLASMVALALAAMTSAHLYREHLHNGLRELAILLSLGASHRQCVFLALGKLTLLGLAATCVAAGATWLLLPLFGNLMPGLLPAGLVLHLDPKTFILVLLIGTVGSTLFCLPILLRIRSVHPISLLREHDTFLHRPLQHSKQTIVASLPTLALLLALTLSLSLTPVHGLVFAAGMLLLVTLFTLIGTWFFRCCRRWSTTDLLVWRITWRNLYRNRRGATAVFVALTTALLLINIIPQVEKGLTAEVAAPEGIELPNLFLIDIQEEQRQPLIEFFANNGGLLSPLAPMVQGRIVSINGMPFARWRQLHQTDDQRVLQRTEFNFSSRITLDASETVVAGPPLNTAAWQAGSAQPFGLSMEKEFSKRLRVGIGDRMVVDIQGIEMEGEIVNLRQVRWISFQPNFFMLTQPGVLDEAPKTYLASVSRVPSTSKNEVVNQLTAAFPNISVIDVNGMVSQLLQIAGQLTNAFRFIAGLTLVTGLMTVIAIARQEALQREVEINLLRVLGARRNSIRLLLLLEFGAVASVAAATAFACSLLSSYVLAWLMFDRLWTLPWLSSALLLLAPMAVCGLTAVLAANAVIRRKPSSLLH